jgi:hypothetical protein
MNLKLAGKQALVTAPVCKGKEGGNGKLPPVAIFRLRSAMTS